MIERARSEAPRAAPPERAAPRLGPGRPLESVVRQRMEVGFGRPLGHVRIHDDASAARAARAFGARAFALGSDLVFGAGQYAPGTRRGDTLLAHELAHALQPARGATSFLSSPSDAAEREAARAAAAVAAGERPALAAVREALVHRDNGDGPPSEAEQWTPPELPPATGETLEFGGLAFSEDDTRNRALLERYYAQHGGEATQRLVDSARSHARRVRSETPTEEENERLRRDLERYGPGDVSGVPLAPEDIAAATARADVAERIADSIARAWGALRSDLETFLPRFQQTGEEIVRVLLDESEREIRAERERYGITERVEFEETFRGGREGFRRVTHYGIASNEETAAMAAAARDLAARLRRIEELHREQQRYTRISTRRVGPEEWDAEVVVTDQPAYDEVGRRIQEARREYDIAREAAQRNFPVLGTYTEDRPDREALETLGGGASPEAARLVAQQTGEKLANIARVRENIGGRFSIWKQPAIVDLTKKQLGVQPGSPRARAVDENIRRIQDEEFWRNLALAVIGVALALVAAIPTGGASIGVAVAVGSAEVAGLALTIYSLQDAIRRYQLESAAAGTAFTRARAIAREEPSLFWVALEVAGAILQIRSAAQTFSRLTALHRAASAARPAAGAADETLEALTREAERVSPRLAQQLAEDVAARRAARGALREAVDDAARAAAEGGGRGAQGTLSALRRFMAELVEAIRNWARRMFARLGFRAYEVTLAGEYIEVYGIRSRVLLARIRVSSVEEWIITETPLLRSLRHSRASQLGRARSADEALARLLRANAVRLSEQIGEEAAMAVAHARYGLTNLIFHGSGSGVFDLVYEAGGVIYIVEAKGGAGRLGTRIIRPGLEAQQGTVTYVRSVLEEMRAAHPQLVQRIENALDSGRLRYILTETPIPRGTAPLETTVSEFVVRTR